MHSESPGELNFLEDRLESLLLREVLRLGTVMISPMTIAFTQENHFYEISK